MNCSNKGSDSRFGKNGDDGVDHYRGIGLGANVKANR